MDPEIIYEDESIVVIDKPAGIIVHPDGRHDYPALTAWLEKRYPEFHLVHRIDRETSGVLVVAKNVQAFEFLKSQFQNREIKKTYRAFVYGALKEERGIIDKPVGSARGGSAPRSAKLPRGTTRDALTAYRVIKNGANVAYVEVFPKTGRTHQIRVHFSAIQHPIVCDSLYAPSRPALLGFARLALHALSLTFRHPSGKTVTFEAPLPPDFVEAEARLRA
ncbi:MAG: RluA family pseudouridine synthase [Patescibacteria group bacterium]|nr:RluA family pseudouridine synthase [Patescibacteria group bacterium]